MDPTTRFSLDQELRPPPPPPSSTLPVLPTTLTTPILPVHHWSDTFLSLPLHSTFIFLHSTIVISLSLTPASPPPLPRPSLTFFSPSSLSSLDSVSTTALGGAGDGFSTALSSRLARSLQRHILCMAEVGEGGESGGLRGAGDEAMEEWVERRVMQELKVCRERGLWK
jgi:hypothetical protein